MAVLEAVREGMKVFDRDGAEIGTVDLVRFGDEDPTDPTVQTTTGDQARPGGTLLDILGSAFDADTLPEAFRARMQRLGFLRIDAEGLLAADRYVLADQIATVSDDGVVLSVARDELARR